MGSKVEDFLTAEQEQQIIAAIRKAERTTSGEIRVHLESHCTGDAYARAQEIFHLLKMDNTKDETASYFTSPLQIANLPLSVIMGYTSM